MATETKRLQGEIWTESAGQAMDVEKLIEGLLDALLEEQSRKRRKEI